MLAKIAALVAHEVHARVIGPVVAEYRKLDALPACERPHVGDRTYDVASTTGGQVERAPGWDHDRRPPVRMGFGLPAAAPLNGSRRTTGL